MKVYSYVVRIDGGFDPNPFWGYCTLAHCTPNHMGIHKNTQAGDWIIGTANAKRNHRLIYAMCVSEVLDFDEYYHDERFDNKKPVLSGNWRQRCGDNIYSKDANGQWPPHPSLHHCEHSKRAQDLKHPFVFVAKHFCYFGDKAVSIPPEFRSLIWPRQGITSKHDPLTAEGFLKWLQANFKPGVHGEPFDNKERLAC